MFIVSWLVVECSPDNDMAKLRLAKKRRKHDLEKQVYLSESEKAEISQSELAQLEAMEAQLARKDVGLRTAQQDAASTGSDGSQQPEGSDGAESTSTTDVVFTTAANSDLGVAVATAGSTLQPPDLQLTPGFTIRKQSGIHELGGDGIQTAVVTGSGSISGPSAATHSRTASASSGGGFALRVATQDSGLRMATDSGIHVATASDIHTSGGSGMRVATDSAIHGFPSELNTASPRSATQSYLLLLTLFLAGPRVQFLASQPALHRRRRRTPAVKRRCFEQPSAPAPFILPRPLRVSARASTSVLSALRAWLHLHRGQPPSPCKSGLVRAQRPNDRSWLLLCQRESRLALASLIFCVQHCRAASRCFWPN